MSNSMSSLVSDAIDPKSLKAIAVVVTGIAAIVGWMATKSKDGESERKKNDGR